MIWQQKNDLYNKTSSSRTSKTKILGFYNSKKLKKFFTVVESIKLSTVACGQLYKYLKIKEYYVGFTKFPLMSAICLVEPIIRKLEPLLLAFKLSPAPKKTLKS